MRRFKLANTRTLEDSEAVILGAPTDLGARSERKGRIEAPDTLRELSAFLYAPESGRSGISIFDAGNLNLGSKNIQKNLETIADAVFNIVSKKKKLIVLGGDCSIKHGIAMGLNRLGKKTGIVYFDAHPDFVESETPYYGSVMADNLKLKNIDPKECILLALRNMEEREKELMKKKGVRYLTALDIKEIGLDRTFAEIKKRVKNSGIIQLSIDLDCVDPAFAPGVGLPCPGGLSSLELLYLIKKMSALDIACLDLTEYVPKFDSAGITGQLACRAMQEFLANR